MIFVTGDIHGNIDRFQNYMFPEQSSLTKDDYIIVCGDFGIIWKQEDDYWEKLSLDYLDNKPFTTLFVDGNHENFNRLEAFPIEEWHGGKIHKISNSVYHLMRGEVFELCGKKIFTFGGASSHDIQDGILHMDKDGDWVDTAREWSAEGKMFRIKDLSWWEQELPSEEEMQNGIENLEKHNNKVDFIITHCPSASVIAMLGHGWSKQKFEQDYLTRYLEQIKESTTYSKWYCGHMHIGLDFDDKTTLLYRTIERIV